MTQPSSPSLPAHRHKARKRRSGAALRRRLESRLSLAKAPGASEADFTVHMLTAAAAAPLVTAAQRLYLRPDSLLFFLSRRQSANPANMAAFGFCIVHHKRPPAAADTALPAGAAPAAAAARSVPVLRFAAENIVKTHYDKNFLEIALFHIADRRRAPRAKTLLLRAIADYCRHKQIDYIFGQFSFEGKYPAAYAREFSCLYHHYRVQKSFAPACGSGKSVSMDIMPAEAVPPAKARRFLPPLLRYCLRLGARAGDHVAVDKSYDQGTGAMNIFLLLPLGRADKTGRADTPAEAAAAV